MSGHVLAARVDEHVRRDDPARELRRARLLERWNTLAELATNAELEEILRAADAVIARRP